MNPHRRYRFAPSPNGRLHLGHAYSALLNQRLARASGGDMLIRIEDIDHIRCPRALGETALDDLAWLGVVSDAPVRWQSDHGEDYAAALSRLKERELVYPCACSRGEIAAAVAAHETASGTSSPRDPDGAALYPGICHGKRRDGAPEPGPWPVAWRLDMARAMAQIPAPLSFQLEREDGSAQMLPCHPGRWGDVVLARKDIATSYHLSVVVDDAIQGITHVVRGTELEAATDIHVLLQRLLGLPVPVYRFHRLVVDAAGRKLAKSRGSESLHDLRESGVSADQVRTRLGF